ncbi:hypothetical protein PMY38_07740 [Clostridium tertium]|uniref:hypothetical protein n=1 Tax=Clostridium tertium TaxID=1559 RepID=UPI00232FA713|nr:hypothetical protein [Clostridium tertium]MDB1956613.1 hypothetical protein [Clostridium tertium]MDB1958484.1 hypothetical protein [Clostridium tertium]MDB1962375.1 hypothetical protein [Clostridium tertium]MDB1967665.1 hypothetical protein [Clostridium tertium]
MYCVIQEVELKKENTYGAYRELEAYYSSIIIDGVECGRYRYEYTGGRFERPIRKAYKVSIHKSYRENGKVKKKQWVIGTMSYYAIATSAYWIGECVQSSKLKKILNEMEISEEELWELIDKKLDPLIEKIQKEYQKTEEYITDKKHDEILVKYSEDKNRFESIYGKGSYDKCYDVFGTLRNSEMLENIKRQYEAAKEYQRSYYENFRSNYSNYNSYSSYQSNKGSTYNEEDKNKYKKLYKTLAKAYHPDIVKDDGEMMKIVNQLKEEWGI